MQNTCEYGIIAQTKYVARLAQSVEHETLNLRVVGSSPTLGDTILLHILRLLFIFILCSSRRECERRRGLVG